MRIAYVLASWEALFAGLKSNPAYETTMPADAEIHHIELLETSRQARIYFTSDSLADVSEASLIAEFDLQARVAVAA